MNQWGCVQPVSCLSEVSDSSDWFLPGANRFVLIPFAEIERFQTGRVWRDDRKMVDVTKEKSLRISSRVLVPVKEHPKLHCQQLALDDMNVQSFGGGQTKQKMRKVQISLKGLCDGTPPLAITAYVVPTICSSPPRAEPAIRRHAHLKGLQLAEPVTLEGEDHTISVLIGQDYMREVIDGRMKIGTAGPIALGSRFGWIISGPSGSGKATQAATSNFIRAEKAEDLLQDLWSLEKFNFVGKLLGPKGNSLKRLQEETMTKMAILGRGSMRDKQKEEELRAAGDPKFSHLSEDLHVEVTAFAPPAEAYARMAYALTEVRRFLVPDYNDEIRQEQMREMQLINESGSGGVVGGGGGGGGDPEGGSTSSGSPPLPVTARPPPANLVLPVTGLLPHPALRGLTPRSQNGLTPSVEQGPAMSRLRSAGLLPLPAAPQTADLTKQLTSLGGDVTDEAAAHAQHQFLELCNSMNGMNGMSGYDLSGLGLLDITRITTLPVSQFADFYAAAPNPEPDASLCRPGDLSLKMAAHHNKLHVRHDPYGRLLMKTS
ncbi:KH domain-containing, RNA-binding, signal transduction-associated protein 2 [Amphibalanus amphitrite]|uniref:KH domain-containing, RNA-binding, signal transduction-associated protein 2 n=1 Tax=Amphibalanus amphitrite TaxID=1232801 RepID=A0A6A4V675_AMPAM|nr:KH domain-containing, RNA-binding, signal transduction-associated protein 2 [Amphibalanus amphitrite]